MGGIKHKLTKQLSKFLPLEGEGVARSATDRVINNKVKQLFNSLPPGGESR